MSAAAGPYDRDPRAAAAVRPDGAPVFVYGALRSGTTMFRLMLGAHADIVNRGEVDFLFDGLRRDPGHPTGWRYDKDALRSDWVVRRRGIRVPAELDGLDLLEDLLAQLREGADGRVLTLNVHRHATRIAAVWPGARFIHLLRDPRDVARSSVRMGWAGLSLYGVDHWVATERDWDDAAIPPERVLTVRFEALMAALEDELARVCDFLGVPFSDAMLGYHRDTTYDSPDPRLVEQWRRKAGPREVALIEGRAGSLLAARGYEAAGDPARPGPLGRTALASQSRLLRWRAGIRRFGLPLLVAAKLSRWLGARTLHARLRGRMADQTAQRVK